MSKKVLLVEDETILAELLRDYLLQAGFDVKWLARGDQVLPLLQQEKFDALLLDVMLPGKDGTSICRDVRQIDQQIAILMTTARVEEIDRLLGLELGADDYICKPYSPREVIARLKAVLRRTQALASPTKKQVDEAEFSLDRDTLTVSIKGAKLELTLVEFQLLAVLINHPGKIFSREKLINMIYDDHRVVSDRTIDSHIKKLRKKIHDTAVIQGRECVFSVYGAGYKFESPF